MWSLGMILYKLIFFRLPYPDIPQVIEQIGPFTDEQEAVAELCRLVLLIERWR